MDDNFVFKNDSKEMEINMHSQIENKMEMILKMIPNSINLSENDQKYILKYCDNILSILNKNEDACTNNTSINHYKNINSTKNTFKTLVNTSRSKSIQSTIL